ncbi:hypothetical protein ACCAA_310066 [Candidatus Accumulibacter aalborgensis]|uniref:Uncharacterized protein n=1 Tax=Candidatus Accumulibacter aalborgensis TaxID=1860102 RepID=A0A1A8XMC5_9PROT|nr:hypothetical protein ACCAA_310066 [Candidatus Accumulibacter aalborgensis]
MCQPRRRRQHALRTARRFADTGDRPGAQKGIATAGIGTNLTRLSGAAGTYLTGMISLSHPEASSSLLSPWPRRSVARRASTAAIDSSVSWRLRRSAPQRRSGSPAGRPS